MAGKSMQPGGGGRFAALKSSLSHKSGITDAGAVAAAIGRKKYGQKKMISFSKGGMRRAAAKKMGSYA